MQYVIPGTAFEYVIGGVSKQDIIQTITDSYAGVRNHRTMDIHKDKMLFTSLQRIVHRTEHRQGWRSGEIGKQPQLLTRAIGEVQRDRYGSKPVDTASKPHGQLIRRIEHGDRKAQLA